MLLRIFPQHACWANCADESAERTSKLPIQIESIIGISRLCSLDKEISEPSLSSLFVECMRFLIDNSLSMPPSEAKPHWWSGVEIRLR
jgi:hypothetical protein